MKPEATPSKPSDAAGANAMPTILVTEDDKNMRELIIAVLGESDMVFAVASAENAHEAMDYLENHDAAVVLTDLRMPGADGLDLLKFVKSRDAQTQVVLITGHATVESAVAALKEGAYDYVQKPFDTVKLRCVVEKALAFHLLSTENQRLRSQRRAFEESGEIIDFSSQESLGKCPKCGGAVFEHGKNYVCEKSVPTLAQPTPSCDFKTGQIILQQPIERTQMVKLLETGKTDLLDKFVSMRTRRNFKAMLAWDAEAGKVNFEFAPSKFPPRKMAASKTVAAKAAKTGATAKKAATKKAAGTKPAAKDAAKPKAPRKTTAASGKLPSAELAAVIGTDPVARTEVVKKLWDYIKANGLQDAANKRAINADAKLLPVFGKPQVTMFELAGIVGKHLS